MNDWLAWLPAQPALRVAAIAAAVLAATTVAVMLYVLALSQLALRRGRRYAVFAAHWRPLLAQAGLDELDPLPTRPSRGEELWFLLLWMTMQRSLRGSARDRLNALLRRLGLADRVVALLRGATTRVRKRLVALNAMRHLADPAHWDDIAPLLPHPNRFIALAAAEALVATDAARAMALLLPMAATRRDWSTRQLENLARLAGPDALTPVLLRLLADDNAHERNLLPLLEYATPASTAAWARRTLDRAGDTDERRASLRVLGALRDPTDRPRILAGLHDADPDLRLVAVQALRRQAGREDIPVLLHMLADASWWVRQETADALATLPGLDAGEVEALLDRVDDRYGHDALQRAIAEARA
ncbi:HEAT repeat domain-containing protein [Lysobacter solisilvae (ex Woo and Kim 2020)]|uniref:HEAT repeat domain-containing protein n=1 Tax=Agrilutibacter terrestris TaxID=2865112 RepID=A0A7H0FU48_9GAMM|nr:HEAT repeat domain-containing protein [Lysobacter terrestris]QNP39564.1 HEAT repeat domain-containing protein [Lysobacter terrestris]